MKEYGVNKAVIFGLVGWVFIGMAFAQQSATVWAHLVLSYLLH